MPRTILRKMEDGTKDFKISVFVGWRFSKKTPASIFVKKGGRQLVYKRILVILKNKEVNSMVNVSRKQYAEYMKQFAKPKQMKRLMRRGTGLLSPTKSRGYGRTFIPREQRALLQSFGGSKMFKPSQMKKLQIGMRPERMRRYLGGLQKKSGQKLPPQVKGKFKPFMKGKFPAGKVPKRGGGFLF